jgi:phage-related protein
MAAAWIIGLGPVMWIGMAVAALVVLIIAYWDEIKAGTLVAWDWFVGKLIWAKDTAIAIFMNFTLIGLLLSHWDAIRSGAESAWNGMIDWFAGIPGWVAGAVSGLGSQISGVARSAWSSFKSASVAKVTEFLSYMRSLPGKASSAMGSLGGLLVGKGKDIVRGLYNGVRSMGGWLRSQLISFAKAMIPGPIAKALGINSPSRVMAAQVGRWIPAGIVAGVEDGAGELDTTMRNLVSVPTAGQTTAASVASATGAAVAASGSATAEGRMVLDVTGADAQWKALVRRMVRVDGRGSVQLAFGS